MFCFLESLDKNNQSLFHYKVKYYTFNLDKIVAIILDNREKIS